MGLVGTGIELGRGAMRYLFNKLVSIFTVSRLAVSVVWALALNAIDRDSRKKKQKSVISRQKL
jgi:hypothetical protein